MSVFEEIILKNKCFGCGMCVTTCNNYALKEEYDKQKGFYEIKLDSQSCNNCGICLQTCPSHQNGIINKFNSKVGDYQNIILAHSTDVNVRKMSTSGGVVNSLIRYLIESDIVDYILLVRKDETSENRTGYQILNNGNYDNILKSPRDYASRYTLYPILSKLKEIDRTKKIAIIGTPCQIQAIKLYNQFHNYNIFTIGIACSGVTSFVATEELMRIIHMRNSEIYYRGDGWPGYNTVYNQNEIKKKPHSSSLYNMMMLSQIFKRHACLACKDQFAEQADISCFDYWNSDEIKNETVGNTGLLIRNDKAAKIVEDMITKEYIVKEKELSEKNICDAQGWILKLKKENKLKDRKVKLYFILANLFFVHRVYKLVSAKGYHLFNKIFFKIIR